MRLDRRHKMKSPTVAYVVLRDHYEGMTPPSPPSYIEGIGLDVLIGACATRSWLRARK